jgi:hydrogenase maturation protease
MLVAGVGSPERGDDAAGLAVVRGLAGSVDTLQIVGDATALLDAFAAAAHVVVVDAADSGDPPGTVRRFDARAAPVPDRTRSCSTHALGVPDAIELARALGRLPDRLEVLAIAGADFTLGAPLTPEVRRAVADLTRELAVCRPAAV